MLPSEAAQRQETILAQYPALVRTQVSALTRKMLILGFPATFTKLLEGPVVRTFYFKPAGNSRFSSVLGKTDELAGALAVESVQVKRELGSVVIEVPREERKCISFDKCVFNLLTSTAATSMALPLLMGQNTVGEYLYADLAKQPHLLIAGATNSGKSVYTAQLICSLSLFRSPQEVEFILVDTKNLDLVLFKTLPHVKYVLNNVNDLRAALVSLLEEVRLRNAQMSGLCRNISEWNRQASSMGEVPMKYKILIIDELADVLDQDEALLQPLERKLRPPSIHSLLKTIAQISRAAGVHLILATQRPSVKILSGDVKANFPARVCFKLPSQTDSRVVLDEPGAENLLGMGDYLYKIAGNDTVKRAHSAYVSLDDIASTIAQNEQIRRQYAVTR
jgi:DNA segregation ATPase FtsK/SpoIIIE, S-DNA-T family